MRSVYEERGVVRGLRDAALLVLREKFGDLPKRGQARVRSMNDERELMTLLKALLHANSLADLGLEGESTTDT